MFPASCSGHSSLTTWQLRGWRAFTSSIAARKTQTSAQSVATWQASPSHATIRAAANPITPNAPRGMTSTSTSFGPTIRPCYKFTANAIKNHKPMNTWEIVLQIGSKRWENSTKAWTMNWRSMEWTMVRASQRSSQKYSNIWSRINACAVVVKIILTVK